MFLRLLLSMALVAVSLVAQSSTGTATMVGAVIDSTGSVVPGANITHQHWRRICLHKPHHSGGYGYVPNLNPGSYQLRIEAQGFKTYIQNGITLRTGEQPRLDVSLEVGNVTESIQVTGTAPLLETETSTSGQVLEGQTLVKMPVLQKAFYRIYLYMPGMNVG